MGVPALYCTPVAGDGAEGTTQRLAFPAGVNLATWTYVRNRRRDYARPPAGRPRITNYGGVPSIVLEVAGLTDGDHAAFLDRLDSLESALTLGAVVHFCRDRDKAGVWPVEDSAGSAYVVPAQADTSGYYAAELLGLETSPTLSADDRFCIETEPPEDHCHTSRISAWSGGAFSWSAGFFHESSAEKALIRYRDSFYGGFVPQEALGAPLLQRDGLTAWRLRLEVTVSARWVFNRFP